MYFLMIKISIFWGDLSGVSAKTATLAVMPRRVEQFGQTLIVWFAEYPA